MTDIVSIANHALTLLEADLITGPDDNRTNAKIVRAAYERVYRYVLRQHTWNCAMCRKSLPAEAEAPAFGYDRQFLLPTEPLCLRLVEIVDTDEPHEVEGRKILTNAAAPLKVRYIGRVSEDQLDPGIAEVIGTYLAAQIAPRIKSNAASERMLQLYERVLSAARSNDAMECTPPEDDEPSIISARW